MNDLHAAFLFDAEELRAYAQQGTPHTAAQQFFIDTLATTPQGDYPASLLTKGFASQKGNRIVLEPVISFLLASICAATQVLCFAQGVVLLAPKLLVYAAPKRYAPHKWAITPFENAAQLAAFLTQEAYETTDFICNGQPMQQSLCAYVLQQEKEGEC